MDFITSMIASALGSLGVEAVKYSYTKLKELICSRYGEKSALAGAVQQLEQNPDSEARKAVVAEELAKSGAHQDKEILEAAGRLQELLKAVQPQAAYHAVQSGSGAIAQGPGSVAAGAGGVAVGGNVYTNSSSGEQNSESPQQTKATLPRLRNIFAMPFGLQRPSAILNWRNTAMA